MNTRSPRSSLLVVALAVALAPAAAQACSEGMFNSGKGLAFQTYLAPRPARVLIYSTAPEEERAALHAGLQKAGHRITEVSDAAALVAAIRHERYDAVITRLDAAEQIAAQADADIPPVLPIVARAERNSPQVRGRFDLFLLDGASLGQYLRAINRALRSSTN